MSKKINWISIAVGGILGILAIVTFLMAVIKGCGEEKAANPQIQVYINDNDSIVNQLQMDVNHLTELIEQMDKDSLAVEVKRLNKGGITDNNWK